MTNVQYLVVAGQAIEAGDYYAAQKCARMACLVSAPRSEQERLAILAYREVSRLVGQSHITLEGQSE